MDFQNLVVEYRGKTDDELLALELERQQLTPEARTILDHELSRRHIEIDTGLKVLRETASLCLDDVPTMARLAARQQFLRKWGRSAAIAPFAIVLVVVETFFPRSESEAVFYFAFASILWALALIAYYFFLLFAIKCPACGWKFGSGNKCMNCEAPRHRR